MSAWDFFQDQVLGMQWLNDLINWILVSVGLDTGSQMGSSVLFFIYDTLKILILLVVLIYIISYIQSYFPPERTKKILGRLRGLTGRVTGALLGTVTPFCSCSSIPIFIGFNKAGLPLGTSISFLISSPLVDIASIIILMGIFGAEVAFLYVVVGVLLAVVGGTVIDRMHMDDQIMDFARARPCCCGSGCCQETDVQDPYDFRTRSAYSWEQVRLTVGRVWKYILVGVLIGALIHDWIPEDIIQAILGDGNPFSVVIATLVGVPMYADIFGTIPIAEALVGKSVEIGTILAFMMGVTATSLPSIMMLKSVMKTRLLVTFIVIVIISIIVTGYLFNFLQPLL